MPPFSQPGKHCLRNFSYKVVCEKSRLLLGLQIDTSSGHTVVTGVDAVSQAARGHVEVGDWLIFVNEKSVQDQKATEVIQALRECRTSPEGRQTFTLTFWRGPDKPNYYMSLSKRMFAKKAGLRKVRQPNTSLACPPSTSPSACPMSRPSSTSPSACPGRAAPAPRPASRLVKDDSIVEVNRALPQLSLTGSAHDIDAPGAVVHCSSKTKNNLSEHTIPHLLGLSELVDHGLTRKEDLDEFLGLWT